LKQKNILVIAYGMGNIKSVCNGLDLLGGSYVVSDDYREFAGADAFILPGVGAFGAAMDNLKRLHIVEALETEVREKGKPYLGICLGMQLLAKDSEEIGFHQGLGWIDGHVVALKPADGLAVPHVGWNDIKIMQKEPLFSRLDDGGNFYFDHSYHLQCDPSLVMAECDYGGKVVAAIRQDNLLATQFHPEKSQRNGLKLLRNYLNFIEEY